jgi:hypothetical protein
MDKSAMNDTEKIFRHVECIQIRFQVSHSLANAEGVYGGIASYSI